jgi:phosphomannomutase
MTKKARNASLEIQGGFVRGRVGAAFNAQVVTNFGAAFGEGLNGPVVVGRDGRVSGEHYARSVISAMNSVGLDVYALGVVPSATLALAAHELNCAGAISITPGYKGDAFSGLKFFDRLGRQLTQKQFAPVLARYNSGKFKHVGGTKVGKFLMDYSCLGRHIQSVSQTAGVNLMDINRAQLTVVLDCANAGASAVAPELLRCIGVEVIELNCQPGAGFSHPPDIAAKDCADLARAVKRNHADLGIQIDADGSRIALVSDRGKLLSLDQALLLPLRQISRSGKTKFQLEKHKLRKLRSALSEIGVESLSSESVDSETLALCKKTRSAAAVDSSGVLLYPAGSSIPDALITIALTLSDLATSRKTMTELLR